MPQQPEANKISIDIVVPVFNALQNAKECLVSLSESTDNFNVKIIVINDSSDEQTTLWLRQFCLKNTMFTLIENLENMGYTKSVNIGLKTSTADFVITQNSDTIVCKGWLVGLVNCMKSDPKIGICGPLSNAATWQNVPKLYDDSGKHALNDLPKGFTVTQMAEVVSKASLKRYPRLPLVNGFCFMIKREVINKIGFMDEENFPFGYGEENDYCIRALDVGYELAIADDTYVYHAKSKSFGHVKRLELSKNGNESLKRKHSAKKYTELADQAKNNAILDEVRAEISSHLISYDQSVLNPKKLSKLQKAPFCFVEENNKRKKIELGIIILNLNGAALLDRLFESIYKNPPNLSYRIFVTDHASEDDSVLVIDKWKLKLPIEVYYAEENFTFSYSNNRWVEKLFGYEKILFLNNDIVFKNNVIDSMAKVLNDPSVGVVGIEQLELSVEGKDRQWHHLGIGFRWDSEYTFWRPFNITSARLDSSPSTRQEVAVTGSVMMLRRNDFLAVGGFHEGYIYGYEDVDLCLAIYQTLNKKSVCFKSDNVVHADGVTRKKTLSEVIKTQRLNNIALLRKRFSALVTRIQRKNLASGQTLSIKPPRIVFAVTEIGESASAGDLFTAMELGGALEREFGWVVEYRPRGEEWYLLDGVDIVVAMVDAYETRRIRNAHPGLLKIAWARNWFDRWCDKEWCDEYDLYLASSKLSADYIERRIGQPARVLRIAANPHRFNKDQRKSNPNHDFVFTGSYWNAERDIASVLIALPQHLKGAIYGKNWEKVPELKNFSKGFVQYADLPGVYREANIVIDDANHVTKPWGSVNSRVFDALSAGCLVITNSELASQDAFNGDLPVYKSPEHLNELLTKYTNDTSARESLQNILHKKLMSEHTYLHRAYEFRKHVFDYQSNSLRISIKIPVPKRELAQEWGDFHFAQSLAKELRANGNSARIDFLPDWNRGDSEGDDVVIVLRGLSEYNPRPNQLNLLWLISHPDKVSDLELNGYDHVFVASKTYATELANRLVVPVSELLQCTDKTKFHLNPKNQDQCPKNKVLFVGNSRKQFRPIVKNAIEAGIDIDIYGTRWEEFVSKEHIKGQNIPNDQLAGYYANAGVVLNDHWPDMAKKGFISNRIFDALACGATVVSDNCEGLDNIFGGALFTYQEKDE